MLYIKLIKLQDVDEHFLILFHEIVLSSLKINKFLKDFTNMHDTSYMFINIEHLREKLYRRQTFKTIAIEAFQARMELQEAISDFNLSKDFVTKNLKEHDYDTDQTSIQPSKVDEINFH